MSETPATPFHLFWSALARGAPNAHRQALHAFQEQLAAFASFAGAERSAGPAYGEALLRSFQVFAQSALRPPTTEFADAGAAACARFTIAAAELQSRLAEANAATVADVHAQIAVRAPNSMQELFDRWVERYEQHLFELLTEPAFGAAFGTAVNAALECYRDTVAADARHPSARRRAIADLQHDVEALAARIADVEARLE